MSVTSEPRFEYRAERALFHTRAQQVLAPFAVSYAVNADGTKFLIRSERSVGASRTVTVIANALLQRERR